MYNLTNQNNKLSTVNRLLLILLIIGNQFVQSSSSNELNKDKLSTQPLNEIISKPNLIRFDQSNNNSFSKSNLHHLINDSLNKLYNASDTNTGIVILNDNKSSDVRIEQKINRLIDLNKFNVFNSLMNVTKIDKLNDRRMSNITNNLIINNGNQSQISLQADKEQNTKENEKSKINSTISNSNIEQMSFIFSLDKMITNLTNDQNLNKIQFKNHTIIYSNVSYILSPSLNVNSPKSSSNLLSNASSIVLSNVTFTKAPYQLSFNKTLNTHKIIKKMQNNQTRPLPIEHQLSSSNKESNLFLSDNNKTKLNYLLRNQTNNQTKNLEQQQQQQKDAFIVQLEKVLVYPEQTNLSNDQSLSAQSKRAPHYLEEKFRVQPEKLSTTSTTASPRLDRPTPILDTRPLIENVDSELNLKALNERLISEEELIHHGSSSSIEESSSGSSYEFSNSNNHHNTHHLNLHHSSKHNNQSKQDQTTALDLTWFKQNCLKNCSCELNSKWPEVNGQSRKTLNCSSKELNDYPIITSELSKYIERLSLSFNNLKTLQINADEFKCEKLIELDLSNNQLQQLNLNSFNNYKHNLHPVIEFHPSHNHHIQHTNTKNDDNLLKTSTASSAKLNETTTTSSNSNKQHLNIYCHRLKILVLSGNDLNTLCTGCFRGLKRLRKLYLDNAQIKFIEKNAFLGVNELRLLSLRYNLLNGIHLDMFQHMINLKILDLTGNSLSYLGAGVFNSLVALQALHLGHNKLKQLSFQCFSGLDGLQLLTLNSNQIDSVPRFALQPLKKLKILDMSDNPIKQILEDDFSHSFVQLLLLNHLDKLQHVGRFAFWDLPYLNELQISHCNNFVHLDEQSIVGAPSLHRLRLDQNALSQLDDRLLENLARMTIAARRQLKVYLAGNSFLCDCFLKPVYLCANEQSQCKIELPDRENITCAFNSNDSNLTNESQRQREKNSTKQIYRINELTSNQLPNECAPIFVPIITPINMTIVRRLRSKLTLNCKAQGNPTPNVYWLQPSGEMHKEKLLTRHGHDLVESDLLTLPHSFQNSFQNDIGTSGLLSNEQTVEQTENQLANQGTAAFLPYTSGVLMSTTNSLSASSTAHHGSSNLRISHLTPNDAGLYTCIAENRLGLIRSHVQLITQQLKIELEAENTTTNYITIRWQVNSIFNPLLNEILGNDLATPSLDTTNSTAAVTTTDSSINSTESENNNSNKHHLPLNKFNINFDEAMINARNEQNLNQLDYQLLYKADSYGADEDANRQTSAETLGSDRVYESNKFFASYESIQINRQLKSFTVAGLMAGTRYKICIAVRENRLNELNSVYQGNLFRKRAIRRFKRLKRNLISVESANYLAIGCLHESTTHAAYYARNILRVEKFHLPALLSNALGTAIKFSLICLFAGIVIALFVTAYTFAKQHQRRSAYETPRKTLLSIATGYSQNRESSNTPYSTPSHSSTSSSYPPELQMQNIYSSPLAREN